MLRGGGKLPTRIALSRQNSSHRLDRTAHCVLWARVEGRPAAALAVPGAGSTLCFGRGEPDSSRGDPDRAEPLPSSGCGCSQGFCSTGQPVGTPLLYPVQRGFVVRSSRETAQEAEEGELLIYKYRHKVTLQKVFALLVPTSQCPVACPGCNRTVRVSEPALFAAGGNSLQVEPQVAGQRRRALQMQSWNHQLLALGAVRLVLSGEGIGLAFW